MNGHYEELKSDVGIGEQIKHADDDNALDDILQTLKPNTTASNFKEFLGVHDNCNKTQAWRAISRKMYRREKRKEDEAAEPVDPKNMKVSQLFNAF